MQSGVAKSVIGRNASAEKRSGFRGCDLIRNRRDAARFGDHHLGVSSIHCDSRDHWVLAIHDVSTPAWFAHAVFSGDEADTDALAEFPSRHSATQGVNAANHFVSRNSRQNQARVASHYGGRIGVTDSTCFHTNANLTCSGLSDRPLHYSKFARLVDFHRLVRLIHLRALSSAFRFRRKFVTSDRGTPIHDW
jgi:hypothetical protein